MEHEFDHVFVGEYEGEMIIDKGEVMDYCYRNMQEIKDSLRDKPDMLYSMVSTGISKN